MRASWWILVSLFVGVFVASMLGGARPAAAFCNPSHQAWDPCDKQDDPTSAEQKPDRQLPGIRCEDLDLRVRADVGAQTCQAGGLSNGDARGRAEIVSAEGAGSFFLAEYVNAGMRTYVQRSSPAEIAKRTGLMSDGDSSATSRMQGFDVRRFKGVIGMHCTAFTKHWGHMPQTPGYRHRIAGVYCSIRESDVADSNLDRLLASIEPSG
jgi:hypothetical protein